MSERHPFYHTIVYGSPLSPSSKLGQIQKYNSYTHTVNALGGYWTAGISFSASKAIAEDWFDNGLSRGITIYNPSGVVIWNGFVNEVSVQLGTLTATTGPVKNIANRVSIVYSTVDTTTDPPVVGMREKTAVVNDSNSQSIHGVVEKVLSSGGATTTTAEQIRDTYLEENKDPETSEQITIGSASKPVVTLNCLGYVHRLEFYTYNETTTGTRTYSLRIQDALAADPNALFSTDYNNIANNTATVPRYDNDDRSAWQVVKGIVSKGDTSFNRYIFGIYEDQKAYYEVGGQFIYYRHRVVDNKQRIEDYNQKEVKPWNILPGRWIEISDWLIGRVPPTTNLRLDARDEFIESARYTAPWGLSINGNKLDTLPQLLGQLGLTGIGA